MRKTRKNRLRRTAVSGCFKISRASLFAYLAYLAVTRLAGTAGAQRNPKRFDRSRQAKTNRPWRLIPLLSSSFSFCGYSLRSWCRSIAERNERSRKTHRPWRSTRFLSRSGGLNREGARTRASASVECDWFRPRPRLSGSRMVNLEHPVGPPVLRRSTLPGKSRT
jgi:hypothetical protein